MIQKHPDVREIRLDVSYFQTYLFSVAFIDLKNYAKTARSKGD